MSDCWMNFDDENIREFKKCLNSIFCCAAFAAMISTPAQKEDGLVSHIIPETFDKYVLPWLKKNCRHPDKEKIIEKYCKIIDLNPNIKLPYSVIQRYNQQNRKNR